MHRSFAALLVVASALAVGCGKSNNEGKIVGKWRYDTVPYGDAKQAETFKQTGAYFYLEFQAGGVLLLGIDSDQPGLMERLPNAQLARTPRATTYKLLPLNSVEIAESRDPTGKVLWKAGRVELVIDGDTMRYMEPDGVARTLTRMKDPPTTK
jgi:hypothetical protein